MVKNLPQKPHSSQPLLRCHCVEMEWSCNKSSNTYPIGCGGRPNCRICACSWSFAWAVVDTNDFTAELNIEQKGGEGFNTRRATANYWVYTAFNPGKLAGDAACATLIDYRQDGRNASSDEQITIYTEEATDIGTSQFILSNAPSRTATGDIQYHISKLGHHLGRGYIRDLNENDINLRPNAVAQWVSNKRLADIEDIEVIKFDSKPSSSKCSSVTVVERCNDEDRVDRTQRLKKSAMLDIENDSPVTKTLSKKLFCKY